MEVDKGTIGQATKRKPSSPQDAWCRLGLALRKQQGQPSGWAHQQAPAHGGPCTSRPGSRGHQQVPPSRGGAAAGEAPSPLMAARAGGLAGSGRTCGPADRPPHAGTQAGVHSVSGGVSPCQVPVDAVSHFRTHLLLCDQAQQSRAARCVHRRVLRCELRSLAFFVNLWAEQRACPARQTVLGPVWTPALGVERHKHTQGPGSPGGHWAECPLQAGL